MSMKLNVFSVIVNSFHRFLILGLRIGNLCKLITKVSKSESEGRREKEDPAIMACAMRMFRAELGHDQPMCSRDL